MQRTTTHSGRIQPSQRVFIVQCGFVVLGTIVAMGFVLALID
jgi:hypothetical protein